MPTELRLYLSPAEAASGTTRAIDLPSGRITVRVPPTVSGNLLKIPTGTGEALVRVQIWTGPGPAPGSGKPAGSGASTARPAKRRPSTARILVPLVVIGGFLGLGIWAASGSGDSSPAADLPAVATTPDDGEPTLAHTDPDTPFTQDTDPDPDLPVPVDSTPASTPDAAGTCFNGVINSPTPVSVYGVNQVDCGASDAHYRVIQVFTDTQDLEKCDSNKDMQYAIAEQDTYGAVPVWEAVYCLVGLGSYATH